MAYLKLHHYTFQALQQESTIFIRIFSVTPTSNEQLKDVPEADTADSSTRCRFLDGLINRSVNILWGAKTYACCDDAFVPGREASVRGGSTRGCLENGGNLHCFTATRATEKRPEQLCHSSKPSAGDRICGDQATCPPS